MGKLKILIREASILLLHKNIEVGTNFTFYGKDELVKSGVFGRLFVKLS
jgi:hypothetical protein